MVAIHVSGKWLLTDPADSSMTSNSSHPKNPHDLRGHFPKSLLDTAEKMTDMYFCTCQGPGMLLVAFYKR